MLKGFFDESNKNARGQRFILAGWVASVEVWEDFSKRWHDTLQASPTIASFKFADSNNLSSEFLRLTRTQSESKRFDLAKVVSDSGLRGYVTTVSETLLASKPPDLRKLMGTRPYDWAFMNLIPRIIIDHLERGEAFEKIDFIFDRCTELRACTESYEREREKWPPSMRRVAGEIVPGNDEELTGLQAADLLAGEISIGLRTGQDSLAGQTLHGGAHPVLY